MDIVINDGIFFRKLVTSIKEFVNLAEFVFEKDKMYMHTMDLAHICALDILLPSDFFEKYNIDKNTALGFNFESLSNILKLSKNSSVGLLYKEGNKINIDVSENAKKKVNFEMNLVHIDEDRIEMMDFTYDFVVYMDTDEFQKSIKDLLIFGTKCTIVVTKDNITFHVSGDSGTGKISLSDIEIEHVNKETNELSISLNTKYLSMFSKANLSNQVIIKFSKVFPFCCEYTMDHGHVKFFLGQMEEN